MQTQQPKCKALMAILALTLLLSFTPVCHAADNLTDFNTICDWLEINLPDYFSPMGVQTSETSGFLVRYYQNTSTYVGTINGDFYVLGSAFGNEVVNVGTMEYLLSLISPPTTTCDSNHLDFCGGSDVCATAGGYWYDYKCHATPKPAPTCRLTCSSTGFTYTCGSGSSSSSKHYCYIRSTGYVSSYTVTYGNGHTVTCTSSTCGGALHCRDDTGRSCVCQFSIHYFG